MIRSTMALRNTVRQPRRTFLLGGAIAFGVIVICLVSGFSSGMEAAVQNNVTLYSGGHILVNGMSFGGATLGGASEAGAAAPGDFASRGFGRVQNRITDATLAGKVSELLPEATSVVPTAQAQTTIVFGSREQQLRVRGVEWKSDRLFAESLVLAEGSWEAVTADRSILLGSQSARRFGLGLGDTVYVKLSTTSGQQNVTEYAVAAIYEDSAAGGMSTALVPLDNLLADLGLKDGAYQSLAIFLPDASKADETATVLAEGLKAAGFTATAGFGSQAAGITAPGAGSNTLGGGPEGGLLQGGLMRGGNTQGGGTPPAGFTGANAGAGAGAAAPAVARAAGTVYRITTITQLSGQMGTVLGTVRWIGMTIFAIMLVLTAAGITNTYRMVLMERTREIGMLRCIGFRCKDIFRIFIYEAILIAIGGSVAGILMSLPVGLLVHLIPMNPSGALGSALARGHLLFSPDLLSYIFVIFAVAAASVVAVYGPARKAARLLPVEALRQTA
jgi:putative ABC transport system permease protein